jgi:two-component system sensor histidine kinase/response regulator
MMVVPLVSKAQVIGVLHFKSKKRGVYTDADLKLAERVGRQIAGVVATSQLFIEHQRVEKQLCESKEILEKVTQGITEGIFLISKDFKILWANKTAVEQAGTKIEEIIGNHCYRVTHHLESPCDYPLDPCPIREFVRTRNSTAFTHTHFDKEDNKSFVEVSVYPVMDEHGEVAQFVHMCRDITERKRAESALLKSEEEARWLARENATIAEMGRIISSTLKIEEVYERFAEEVRMLIPFERIVINLNNYEDNTFRTAYVAGGHIGNRCSGDVVPLPGSVNEEMVCTRKGLLFHPAREDEIADRFPILLLSFRAGFRSMLFAPLISNDEVIGCLNLQSTKPNVYTENDLRLAEKVSHQIAGAIANAQLFDAYKRAEKALRENEERFRDLYDNAPFGYHEYDAEGRVISCNRADLEMLGYTRDEMIGQFVWEFYVEEETAHQEILAKLEGTLPTGRSFEGHYRRKDGTTFPVLIGERVSRDESGQTKSIRCTIQDITDRKETEEVLKRAWSRYRTLFNSSGDAVFIHDLEGRVLEVNQVACDRLGYSQDEFAQMTLGQIVSSEHAASVPRLIEEELSRGHALFETVHVSKDGRAIPTEVSSVVFEYNGHPAVLSVVRDITERKRTEETLIRLGTAVSQSIDGIAISNLDGKIQLVNGSWCRTHGYTDSEIVEQHLNIFHTKEQMVDVTALRGQAMNIGFAEGEIGHVRKDGTVFPTWMSCTVLKDQNGTPIGFVGIARDITGKKKAEAALLEAKENVDAANRELQTAIERANRLAVLAEHANQAKSEFLANMSHEIRTPMIGIMGMTGLLLDTELTVEQEEYAETIKNSTNSLLGIINDILDFSKIETGKLELETLDFDLHTTLEDLTDILALNAHAKGLELSCLIEPEVPALLQGDPGRLRQILTNLIGNAIKFTPKGEVILKVSVDHEDDTRARVRFEVKDTGIGIPKDKIAMLFRPFTQVDASITRRYGGTGLGLSISRKLAEMMGGEIGAESREGIGSTFWVIVPLTKQPTAMERETEVQTDIAGTRILVVDDNETNRQVLAGMLDSWNCTHDEAFDASSAMEKLKVAADKGHSFHIALLDMFMPGMDGETLGRRIKDDPILRDTLLVMMASVGKRGDAVRLERTGFAAYLTKPVKKSLFHDCIVTVMNRKPHGKSSRNRIITRHTVAEDRKRKVRILLAEDNIVNQKVILKFLEKMGYRADVVANGLEVLKALEAIPYTLVLMDVQMPEMDGIEATRRIRSARSSIKNPNVPIIALTAHAMKEDRKRCLDAGMNDYLAKPIQPDQLAEMISRWVASQPESASRARESNNALRTQDQRVSFDKSLLLERLEGDEKIYEEIIRLFLEDVPGQIRSLQEAVSGGDGAMAERQAHTLKGASGNVGALGLQKVAQETEMACRAGNMEKAIEKLGMIKTEFEELKKSLGS